MIYTDLIAIGFLSTFFIIILRPLALKIELTDNPDFRNITKVKYLLLEVFLFLLELFCL